jgi:zinc protease
VERSIYQRSQSLFYKDSPYRIPVIGYEDVMLNTSSEDLKTYYKLTYVPENMVVVVGGNLSEIDILSIVKHSFGQLPKKAAPIRTHGSERRILSSSHSSIVFDELTTQRVIIRYPIVSFYHDDVYPLDLLAYIFGNGQQSLLYQEFVVKRSLATNVRVHSITPSYDIGYFEIALETAQNNESVIHEVQDFIDQFRWRRIKSKQIQKAISQKRTEYVLGQNSLDGHLKDIGQSMMMGQNPLFFKQYSTGFSNVTPGDLNRVVSKYLSKNKRQSYVFRNAWEEQVTTQAIKITPPIVEFLREGVEVLKITESNDDIVRITLQFKGGIDEEGVVDNGIGHLTASLLGKQIFDMDRNVFQEHFESRGAKIGANLTHNALTYTITLMTKDAPQLLPLFIKGMTQFDADEATFTEVKAQQLKSIQKTSEDWFQNAFDQLKKTLNTSEGAFSKSLKGSKETVNSITFFDVKNYLSKRLNHSPLSIVVQASNPDAMVAILKKELHKKLNDRPSTPAPLPTFKNKKNYSLNISQPVGVVMRVDPLDEPISSMNQYLNMQLLDALLSGMRYPSGLLHERLRGNQLVYVVHTVHMRWGQKDMLFTYALTDSKNVTEVSTIMNDAFEEIKTTITDEQFKLAKAQVLFNFQNSRQEQSMKSNDMLYHHQTFSSIPNDGDIQQALARISIHDVQSFFKKIMTKSYIFKFNG